MKLAVKVVGAVAPFVIGVAGVGTIAVAGALPAQQQSHVVQAQHKRTVGVPPFFRQDPPSWCLEDMPCWIGSTADGRPTKVALHEWRHMMKDESLSDVVEVFAMKHSDGDPGGVERGAVYDVHDCRSRGYNRTCRAKVHGFGFEVLVAGVDFPNK